MTNKVKVGFLTYDLQQFTEDCLFRIQQVNPEITLTAYPVIHHPHQESSRIPFRPSFQRGSYFGVNVEGSTPEGFASNLNFYAAWACSKDSDIVVLFGLQGATAFLTVALSVLLRKPIVSVNQTLPIEWESKRRWWVILLKRMIFKRCILNISQSAASREVLTNFYSISDNKIVDAPFEAGASIFRNRAAALRENNEPIFTRNGDETIFLFAGNLHKFKGVGTIIHALALLNKDLRLKCYFAGPEAHSEGSVGTARYWTDLARSLGVKHRVAFLGQLGFDQLLTAYRTADVVLLPTQKDCFPKVLVEAAIFSKPLISTNACGATGTILIDKINGFVIDPDDSSALAASMEALLDQEKRAEMGKQSKLIVDRICQVDAENAGYRNAFSILRRKVIAK